MLKIAFAAAIICLDLLGLSQENVIALSLDTHCTHERIGIREAHPFSCSKFIVCIGESLSSVHECPKGLHFNRMQQVCDFPRNAGCPLQFTLAQDQCDSCNCEVCCSPVAAGDKTNSKEAESIFDSTEISIKITNPEIPTLEVPKSEIANPEILKSEILKLEVPKSATPKAEIPRLEIPKSEIANPEILKSEILKLEVPKSATPKAEIPRLEIPKSEIPEPEIPKPEILTIESNVDMNCGDKTNGEVFALQGDCQHFVVCIAQKPTILSCPNNLHWNANAKQCDFPEIAKCPWSYVPRSGPNAGPSGVHCTVTGRCIGKQDGTFYPDTTNDCSASYVVCQCECEVPHNCSEPLMFNKNLGVCDWPSNFGCE